MANEIIDQSPVVRQLMSDLETVYDILFSAKARFEHAILERPTAQRTKDCPALYDGEKLLLGALDRAMSHAKTSVDRANEKLRVSGLPVDASERAYKNYLNALKIRRSKEQQACSSTNGNVCSKPQPSCSRGREGPAEVQKFLHESSQTSARVESSKRPKVPKVEVKGIPVEKTSTLSLGGSSLDDVIAELPIELGDTNIAPFCTDGKLEMGVPSITQDHSKVHARSHQSLDQQNSQISCSPTNHDGPFLSSFQRQNFQSSRSLAGVEEMYQFSVPQVHSVSNKEAAPDEAKVLEPVLEVPTSNPNDFLEGYPLLASGSGTTGKAGRGKPRVSHKPKAKTNNKLALDQVRKSNRKVNEPLYKDLSSDSDNAM